MEEIEVEYYFTVSSIRGIHKPTGTIIIIYGANKNKEQLKKEMFSRLDELVHKF